MEATTYEKGNPKFPIAPAQGATGRNIRDFLGPSLNKSKMADIIGDNARVIIANPVQFQTSLWIIHKQKLKKDCWTGNLRDAVWKTLWNQPQIQDEFCCRLQAYKPDIVLNCCTKELREEVQSVMSKLNLRAQMYLGIHPSSPLWKNGGIKFKSVEATNG